MADKSGRVGRRTKTMTEMGPSVHHHPYEALEGTSLWKRVGRAISDLMENQDIQLMTPREYVIGYICKRVKDA